MDQGVALDPCDTMRKPGKGKIDWSKKWLEKKVAPALYNWYRMPTGPEFSPGGDSGGHNRIPEWAKRERTSDMAWIAENMHVFWPAAKEQYEENGRGAIVVDTTVQPDPDAGHPFGYFPEEVIDEHGDEDTQRMVKQYDPDKELVITLLKSQGRSSIYRIQLPSEGSEK